MVEPQNSPQRPILNFVVITGILVIVLLALGTILGLVAASVVFPPSAPPVMTNTATPTTGAPADIIPTAQFVDAGTATPTAVTTGVPTSLPTPSQVITVTVRPGVFIATPTRAAPSPQPMTATAPAKIATPHAQTATPQTKAFTITDEQATGLARGSVPANVLQNPAVAFTSSHIEITGMASVPGLVSGPARVVCRPQVEDEQLRISVLSVTIGGADVTQFAAAKVEQVVNSSLAPLSAGKRVQSIVLADGSMTVTYLE